MSQITDRIEILLTQKGLKRSDLVRATGINESTIRNWIRGTQPQVEPIYTIAKFLNVSVEFLITGITPESEQQLNQEEKELLQNYRMINDKDQETAFYLLQRLAESKQNVSSFSELKVAEER